jgi:hypothetical protein
MKSIEAREKVLEKLIEEKNNSYWERNQLVAYLSTLFESWLELHPKNQEWEHDWRNIVFIKFPEGTYSWHIHDDDLRYFPHLTQREGNSWDGSTTEQKYKALRLPHTRGTND